MTIEEYEATYAADRVVQIDAQIADHEAAIATLKEQRARYGTDKPKRARAPKAD